MDHICYLCCVYVMFSCLFIADVWSGSSWLSFVMFYCILLLSHVVSWVRLVLNFIDS